MSADYGSTGCEPIGSGPWPRQRRCFECGSADDWYEDGRGNVMCGCQSCPECGIVDAYGFHWAGCPVLEAAEQEEEARNYA